MRGVGKEIDSGNVRHVTGRSDCEGSLPLEEAMPLVPFDLSIEADQAESVGLERRRESIERDRAL